MRREEDGKNEWWMSDGEVGLGARGGSRWTGKETSQEPPSRDTSTGSF